ncbi:SDR family NAD(P)-dependent oxidoreductase [Chloroflexota bacterium]
MVISDLSMANKVVLIPGGRTGLGKAFALAFAEAGADVAICGRTSPRGTLEAVAEEIGQFGRRSLAIKADVTRKADAERIVEETTSELGTIDVLLNCAGVRALGALVETEETVWDDIIDSNLKGSFLCAQAASEVMMAQRTGVIINMASGAAFSPVPKRSAYAIAKAGVVMLTRVLARELAEFNIRVNAIAPGVVNTGMNEKLLSDPAAAEAIGAKIPLGRFGETSDITGAALFLASDAASWITGHTLVVDGGRIS